MSRLSVQVGMGPPEAATGWQPLRIGAGGWLTGLDIAPDGEKVVRADTYGAYRWNSSTSQWDQLITATGIGESSYTYRDTMGTMGVFEIRIAPGNTQRYYMVWDGYVYRTDNRGASWTKTAFSRDTALLANSAARMAGQKMAVDPNDDDTCYLGTVDNGVWYTHDAGASWSQVSTGTIPAGDSDPGHAGIVFDPDSGVNGSGYTNTIYVPSYGNGVWQTTNGGSSWSQIANGSSSPANVWHAQLAADGIYYCASWVGGSGAVWKYNAGWTSLTTGSYQIVAPDPADAARIIIATDGCWGMRESLDRGVTWVGSDSWYETYPAPGSPRVATDIPWLAWTAGGDYLSAGDMRFDPIDGKLYFSEGTGVWKTTFPTTFTAFDWTSQSKGIEQLVAECVWSVPSGALIVTAMDRPIFRVTDPEVFPSTHGPNRDHAIIHGTSIEHAASDTSFLVAACGYGGNEESSYSTDGGVNWSKFSAYPPFAADGQGHIAASTPQNMVWCPNKNYVPYYTTNGGTSWTACPSPVNVSTDWGSFHTRHIVCADRVTANKFYMYIAGVPALYVSTNSGASWSLAYSGHIVSTADGYDATLFAVPGKEGHLFYTNGPKGGGDHSGADAEEYFKRSQDGGETWSTVSNVLEVYAFGFGKEKPGGSYPSIFITGFVNSVFGVWMSDDECSTWTRLGNTQWPLGSVDNIICCGGDMNTYGRCYVGFKNSGWAYWG